MSRRHGTPFNHTDESTAEYLNLFNRHSNAASVSPSTDGDSSNQEGMDEDEPLDSDSLPDLEVQEDQLGTGDVPCSICDHIIVNKSSKMKRCSQCQRTCYCSRECQVRDWPMHKEKCVSMADRKAASSPNYLIKIHLNPGAITDPSIVRILSCPAMATFRLLHRAIQTAFEWRHMYSHSLAITERSADGSDPPPICWPKGPSYPVMPRIHSLLPIPKVQLHIINRDKRLAMELSDEPLTSRPGWMHYHEAKVYEVLETRGYQGKELLYQYDFWEHHLTHIGRAERADKFVCVDGEGHQCAEGIYRHQEGWEELKAAYRAAEPGENQRRQMAWYQIYCANSDIKGLAGTRILQWDKERVNEKLAQLPGLTPMKS